MNLPGRRVLNGAGAACCAAMVLWAIYYATGRLGLEPCPLCIFQRVGVAAIGALFVVAAVHDPSPKLSRVYGVLIAVAASLTMAVAARHLWIQSQPAGSVPACGATLEYMLDVFPLSEVLRKVLTGSGECAEVSWRLLGISMPGWVLISALGLGAGGLFNNWRSARRSAW